MSPRPSPFTTPEAIKPRIKAVLKGPMGAGKTHLALKSPGRIALIDTEGAGQWYAGRPGFEEFDVMEAKNYAEVVAAVDWLAANVGKPDFPYTTLVIDSISLIYTRLQDSATAARTAQAISKGIDPMDVDIEGKDWNKISRFSKTLTAKLINLPMHVIVISREKERKQKGSDYTELVADAHKGMESDFALVVRVHMKGPRRVATVVKDWSGVHGAGQEIENPEWDTVFGPLLKVRQDAKAEVRAIVDRPEADAKAFGAELASPEQVADLYAALDGAGFDPEELRERRRWPEFSQMTAAMVTQLTSWATSRRQEAAKSDPAASVENGEAGPPDELVKAREADTADGSVRKSNSGRGRRQPAGAAA